MNRPEDFVLGPGAHHFCEQHGISEQEAREARANFIVKGEGADAQGDFGDDGSWTRWYGRVPGTGQLLGILCGPDDHTIARIWPEN